MPKLNKFLSLILSFCLILEQSVFAQAIDLSRYFARNSASVVSQSDKFRPLHLRYISYDNQANDFKILLDKGDFFNQETEKLKNEKTLELENTTQELMKYFFIGLALPNEKFWVNLRPDSPDNILDPELEKTDIGRIFLEADLQLKKDTSGMTSPQTKEGREYWDKLYKKAGELFGSESITIPTITRPWIVPNEIIIREAPDNAYIYKATLKVMLEEDYLTSRGGSRTAPTYQQYAFSDPRLKELNEYSTQLIKETIIPKLTYAVNTSKRYVPLRQVYYSLILAQWFKARYASKNTVYSRLINQKDLANLYSKESWDKLLYFKDYQKSFKDGEYNIQEPRYSLYGQTIRSYFSGGISVMSNSPLVEELKRPIGAVNEAVLTAASSLSVKKYLLSVFYVAGKVDIPTQSPDKVYAVGTSSSAMVKNADNPEDLPEHHFIELTPEEFRLNKIVQWHKVEDLDANNPKKILYFRRFEGEFRPPVSLSPELAKTLHREDDFKYYALDEAQRVRLSTVSPYTTQLSMPPGVKIGIVIGYHHLEKPWGHLFRDMFEKQVRFPQGSVQFIVIQNGDIPTGDRSVSSEREIQDAVMREGLTHIIDVHEQLSHLNHYMDFSRASEFSDAFRAGDRKNPRGKEYTLDPFVPLWAIEQYYGGYVYPQLQYAVNEQIRKIEILVENINAEDRQPISLTQNLDSLDVSKFPDFVPSSFPKTAEVFNIIKVVDINAPGAIEPEHDTNIDPQGIVLVHAHAALPKDGILYPNSYHDIRPLGLRNPREIVEFSWNGVIDYWKDNDVVVLVPLKNAPKDNFINLWHAATSHFGPFVIPKGSILLIRSGTKVENDSIIGLHKKGIGVIYFPHGLSVNKAVSQVLMQTGYVPMSLIPMGAFEDGSMVSWVDERTGKDCSPRTWNEFDYRYSRYIYRSHYFMSRLAKELNVPFSSEGTGSYDLGLTSLKMESISKQLVTNGMWEGDVGIKEFSDKFESAYNLLSSEQKASNSGKRFLAIGRLFSQFLKLSRELNNNSGEDAQRLFAFLQVGNDANYRQKRIADSIIKINENYGAEFATSDLQNLDDLFKITRFLAEKDFPGIFDIFEEKDVVHNRKLGNERIGTLSSSLVEPVKRIEDRSQKANMPKSDKGGIDFRNLPIVTQAISNLSLNTSRIPLSRLNKINLIQEWRQIQNMAEVGITPSTERIKEYIQLSCLKGEFSDTQKVISCIADILRSEEERCVSTEPALKDILVMLESGRSAQELKAIFTGSRT